MRALVSGKSTEVARKVASSPAVKSANAFGEADIFEMAEFPDQKE